MKTSLTLVNLPTDGFGSLMEYILGIVFFCHKNGFEYIHTDIKKIEHNKEVPIDIWIRTCNDYIQKNFLNVKNSIFKYLSFNLNCAFRFF